MFVTSSVAVQQWRLQQQQQQQWRASCRQQAVQRPLAAVGNSQTAGGSRQVSWRWAQTMQEVLRTGGTCCAEWAPSVPSRARSA